jgi:hypothetical protein
MQSLNAVFFVKHAPTYELIEDNVHVTYESGQIRAEFVLTRSRFLRAYRAATKVVEAIHKGEDNVVAFGANNGRH